MEQQIITAWAQVLAMPIVGGVQCYLIARGLNQMGKSSEERNRQLDRQDKVMEQQGEVLAELLRQTA